VTSGGEPRTLAGRYRLDEVIGRGGMSTVYRGTDLALDRVVAVKVALDPLVEQSPVYLERFRREANAAAAIDHPGVVTVYDAGADGPTRFIVMEFVPGRSLADILREQTDGATGVDG
jgi:serine/threonine-protein kinase